MNPIPEISNGVRSGKNEVLHDVDIPAEPKKEYSRAEIGKMRRQFMTIHHGCVTACGHAYVPSSDPRLNCEDCWVAHFMTQEGLLRGVNAIVRTFGIPQLKKTRGDKFVKHYERFLVAYPDKADV